MSVTPTTDISSCLSSLMLVLAADDPIFLCAGILSCMLLFQAWAETIEGVQLIMADADKHQAGGQVD